MSVADAGRRFAFGANWASYAEQIDAGAVREAEAGVLKLLDRDALAGRSFLDIGCGSGVHALAALRLGVGRAVAIDLDPDSVATARRVLEQWAPDARWQVEERSVFDLDPGEAGTFDIVYSWGVLHHTGDLDHAMRKAAAMVRPGGLFAFALYRPTTMDPFWVREKRWYAAASPTAQRIARALYLGLFRLALLARRRSYRAYKATYKSRRGMDLDHDVHDWLGGYPYEAIGEGAVDALLAALGFTPVRRFARAKNFGLLGSGCDEYVFRRSGAEAGRAYD